MTHLGVASSSKWTCANAGLAASGTGGGAVEGLRDLLESPEAQASLLLSVQGQVGYHCRREVVGSVSVVSAGSLNDFGEYSIIEFSRPAVGERWVLEDVSVRNVNCLTR